MNNLTSANKAGYSFSGLSGSALKVIALVSMLADHSAYYLLEHGTSLYEAMRCFGRIAFPVFAFLIAEGFAHTRNKLRYFLTLLGFAVVSEVPWFLLNGADGTHNVMFTLAFGVVTLATFEKLKGNSIQCMCAIFYIAYLSTWLEVDYEWKGILIIVIFYLLGTVKRQPFYLRKLVQLSCVLPIMVSYGILGTLLAYSTILLYDGTRGMVNNNVLKYGFYIFYPAHLIALFLYKAAVC